MRHLSIHGLAISVLLAPTCLGAGTNSSKRGIAYLGTRTPEDYNIFLSEQSPISWYYNWSPYPVNNPRAFDMLEFVPLIHGLDDASAQLPDVAQGNIPRGTNHLLSFNEPDHGTDGGGSDISPDDAAEAYIKYFNPMSVANGGNWQISWPATTGTLSGLDWLKKFEEKCLELDDNGCHMDFIATHFYGDFPALASWLGTLNEFYNTNRSADYKIYITEFALPQQSAEATETMLNTTLPYLDDLDYVSHYSWFGLFRQKNANEWTGDGVALLNNKGELTDLGAMYLGPPFKAGLKASDNNANGNAAANLSPSISLWAALCIVLALTI